MGKTNSLNENDLDDFIKLSQAQKLSDNSWSIDVDKIDNETFNLGVQNPNIVEEVDERTPQQIISEINSVFYLWNLGLSVCSSTFAIKMRTVLFGTFEG